MIDAPGDGTSLDLPTLPPGEIADLTAAAIERANTRIDVALASLGPAPTFEELFGALNEAAREVAIAFGRGASQAQLAADDAVRDAAFAALEAIEKWRGAVPTRDDLGAAIERFVDTADLAALAEDERAFVRRWQIDVRLAGAGLSEAARAELASHAARLVELGTTFTNNLVAAPHIEIDRADLDGVPAAVLASCGPGSRPGTVDVAINYSNYLAIMERCRSRAVRERALRAWATRGVPDNLEVLEEVLATRRRMAALLGYPSWQALRIDNLAAEDPATINGFIRDMAERLAPIVRRDVEAMAAVLRAEPGASDDLVVADWDWRYADQLQQAALGVQSEAYADYLEFERVLDGLAELSAEIFGVALVAHPERTGWHPDVRPFDLVDAQSSRVLARLFVDPYVRHGKQPGAWMEILLPGGGKRGEDPPATLSLVLNAPNPIDGPCLLAVEDVETLFHEYGHVLNFALGTTRFVVHRQHWITFDFIEGPSSFLGRWGLQPAVMSRFARHRTTGEPLPAELLEALPNVEALNAGFKVNRLVGQGLLDALLHGENPPSIDQANRAMSAMSGTPFSEGTSMPASLNHIVGGAYDAALYGYSWSEIIRDDLLERFEAGGLTSPAMGATYRSTILEVSWIEDPVAAVNAFLGRRWSVDAFLSRARRGGAGRP